MSASTASIFTDPDELQAALGENCQGQIVVTGRGRFRMSLTRIKLARLCLLMADESLPRVAFLRPPATSVILLLPVDRGSSQSWAGIPLDRKEILTISAVPGVHGWTQGGCQSAAICGSADYLIRTGRQLIGPSFVVPPGVVRWQPLPQDLKALARLHSAAMRVTGFRLAAPTSPEAARGLEQEIVGALAECLSVGPAEPNRRSDQSQLRIMAQLEEILRVHPDTLPSQRELSSHLGVPARTLRAYCHDHLRLAPGRYMRLRRLQRLHRALRRADPGSATVSALERRHGITQPGRFARSYSDLFGELLSATLRRPANQLK